MSRVIASTPHRVADEARTVLIGSFRSEFLPGFRFLKKLEQLWNDLRNIGVNPALFRLSTAWMLAQLWLHDDGIANACATMDVRSSSQRNVFHKNFARR